MAWDSLAKHATPEAVVAFALGLLGVIVGSQVALRWGYSHAYHFGRRLARRLPGHAIEHFLAEQARGLHDGLEEEHASEAAVDASITRESGDSGQVTTLTVTLRPREARAGADQAPGSEAGGRAAAIRPRRP